MENTKDAETCCELCHTVSTAVNSSQTETANISKARTNFCPFSFWIEFMLHCLKDQKEPKIQRPY